MATFDCKIVTPTGPAFEGPAEMVVVPGSEGELGVLARHAPLIARLKAGEVRVRTEGGSWQSFVTSDGFFKVGHDVALVLVQGALATDAVDAAVAQTDADDAESRLRAADAGDESIDRFRAERDLAWAENRLRVSRS